MHCHCFCFPVSEDTHALPRLPSPGPGLSSELRDGCRCRCVRLQPLVMRLNDSRICWIRWTEFSLIFGKSRLISYKVSELRVSPLIQVENEASRGSHHPRHELSQEATSSNIAKQIGRAPACPSSIPCLSGFGFSYSSSFVSLLLSLLSPHCPTLP